MVSISETEYNNNNNNNNNNDDNNNGNNDNNKITTFGCQRSAVGCLIEDKKSKSKRGIILKKKKRFELSPLTVWIAL